MIEVKVCLDGPSVGVHLQGIHFTKDVKLCQLDELYSLAGLNLLVLKWNHELENYEDINLGKECEK